MQNPEDVSENIFVDIKNILSELSVCETPEQLTEQENLMNNVYQKFSYLKIARQLSLSSDIINHDEDVDNQETNLISDIVEVQHFDDADKVAEIIVEETVSEDIFTDVAEVEEVHSFSEIDEQEDVSPSASEELETVKKEEQTEEIEAAEQETSENILESDSDTEEESLLQENPEKLEPMQDSQFSFAMEREESIAETPAKDYETSIAEKEQKLRELEENRKKAMHLSAEQSENKAVQQEDQHHTESEDQQEKKFRLAHIKGLKIAKSLFDEELFDNEEKPATEPQSGSLLKNNVPTDYMEAPKPKPEFKLDLNDRIAFSQHLFGGSQSELNDVVNRLNAFTSLSEAQEFLSDVYYAKDWKKVDNYAQRLWTLVENRFL